MWPKLRVLARSSPTDKHTLVKGNGVGSLLTLPCPGPGWRDAGWVWPSPLGSSSAPRRPKLSFQLGLRVLSSGPIAAGDFVSQRKSLALPEPHRENGDNNGDSLKGLTCQSSSLHFSALTVSMEDASRDQLSS